METKEMLITASLGLIILGALGLFGSSLLHGQSANVPITGQLSNTPPVITQMTATKPTLVAGSNAGTATVVLTVVSNNGFVDNIQTAKNVTYIFYSGPVGAVANDNPANHYSGTAITTQAVTFTPDPNDPTIGTVTITIQQNVQQNTPGISYYAVPTLQAAGPQGQPPCDSWYWQVTVVDKSGASATKTVPISMPTLLAGRVNGAGSIDLGTLAPGQMGCEHNVHFSDTQLENVGNVKLDHMASATDLNGPVVMPADTVHQSIDTGYSFASCNGEVPLSLATQLFSDASSLSVYPGSAVSTVTREVYTDWHPPVGFPAGAYQSVETVEFVNAQPPSKCILP
ncbi:MAG: hypothetical protein U0R44_02545 [Candidatus Micrarchaeia archaeon]